MTLASVSDHDVRLVAEVTQGTTPPAPQTERVRNTGCTLEATTTTSQSKEIRSGRQITGLNFAPDKVAGSIPIEFSYGAFDKLLAAALMGDWATDVLEVSNVRKFFTIERAFTDISLYRIFRGCMVDKFSLSMKADATEVTGSFDFIGLSHTNEVTSLDATPTDAVDNPAFDVYTGEIKEGGSAIAILTGFDLSVNNALKERRALMSRGAIGCAVGRSNVTGSFEAYLQDKTLLDKFFNRTATSVGLTLGNGTAKTYEFDFPKVKYTSVETVLEGENDVLIRMGFQAMLDSVSGTNLIITRIPGA